jgi:hypothetical protein
MPVKMEDSDAEGQLGTAGAWAQVGAIVPASLG